MANRASSQHKKAEEKRWEKRAARRAGVEAKTLAFMAAAGAAGLFGASELRGATDEVDTVVFAGHSENGEASAEEIKDYLVKEDEPLTVSPFANLDLG